MMIDLDELMRLHAAATPGPWEVKSGEFEGYEGYGTVTAPYIEADGKMICVPFDFDPEDENYESDAAYIVAACNAVPELVARIRELERQRYWLDGQLAHVCRSYLNCGLDCPNPRGECVETTAKQWAEQAAKAAVE